MATTNKLVVELSLDISGYRAGLLQMLTSGRAAAEQLSEQMRAGAAGLTVPALDTTGIREMVEEAKADLDTLMAKAREPILLPKPTPPPPADPIEPPDVKPPKVPPFDTSSYAVVKSQVKGFLAQPFESLTLTFAQVKAAKAALDAQMQGATTAAARAEVAQLAVGLDTLEGKMRAAAQAQSGVAVGAGSAQGILFGLVQTTQDVSAANGDLGLTARYAGNNIVQLTQLAGGLSAQAAAAGTTLRATLLASLTGPTGLLLGAGMLVSLLPQLIGWLGREEDAHRSASSAIREQAEETGRLADETRRLTGARAAAGFAQLRDGKADLERQLRGLNESIRQVDAEGAIAAKRRREALAARQGRGQYAVAAPSDETLQRERQAQALLDRRASLTRAIATATEDLAAVEEKNQSSPTYQLGRLQQQRQELLVGRLSESLPIGTAWRTLAPPSHATHVTKA